MPGLPYEKALCAGLPYEKVLCAGLLHQGKEADIYTREGRKPVYHQGTPSLYIPGNTVSSQILLGAYTVSVRRRCRGEECPGLKEGKGAGQGGLCAELSKNC